MPKNPNVRLNVPLRSGFDKSHHSLLTSKVGTITPILVDELTANSKLSVRMALAAQLPPLASDCFLKADIRCEAFFVPMRILYSGFEDFFCDNQPKVNQYGSMTAFTPVIPTIGMVNNYDSANNIDAPTGCYGPGSLADYLGIRGDVAKSTNTGVWTVSALPFLAYHRIWNDWYRSGTIQNECFCKPDPSGNTMGQKYAIAALSHTMLDATHNAGAFYIPAYYDNTSTAQAMFESGTYKGALLADDVHIGQLRQRNFGFDYFTNAQPSVAYRGDVSVSTSSGSFTIAALRYANSLQIWRERNSIAGTRFTDVLTTRFGADLSDGVAQRPIFLGSANYPILSRTVSVTGDNTAANNPFAGAAGGEVGRAFASGSDYIVDGFTTNEPGYLFINATLVPHVTYSSGCRRYLKHYDSVTDFADPIFQNTGNQAIYEYELTSDSCLDSVTQYYFGFTDRYAEYMTMEDEVHGLISEGQSLASFASQRYIDGTTSQINTDFLTIPTDYLDDVTAVKATLSDYGYWMDVDFQYHVSMPLAEYSMPSLQDPAYEHGQRVTVHRGGFRF